MGLEFLVATYKRPGFPRTENTERSYRNVIEYVGPQSTLEAQQPAQNETWGGYPGRVASSTINPLEGTDQAIMRIVCEYQYSEASNGGGQGASTGEVTYETDWELFTRPMYEHPEFTIEGGGTYTLTSQDISEIEQWKNETDVDLRKVYKFDSDSGEVTLSTNGKMFARGYELGQETFEDYAPIVRVTTTFTDGGGATGTDVGTKDNPPSAANGPSGYEWRKTADRDIRTGGQTRHERVEEWIGAKKVLIDRDAIFWTAPT